MIIISTDMEFNLPVRYEMCASSAHVVHRFSHIFAYIRILRVCLLSTGKHICRLFRVWILCCRRPPDLFCLPLCLTEMSVLVSPRMNNINHHKLSPFPNDPDRPLCMLMYFFGKSSKSFFSLYY